MASVVMPSTGLTDLPAAAAGVPSLGHHRPRVLQVVLGLEPGGTERLVVELVHRLSDRVPMAVCCLDDGGAWAARLTSMGVPVVSLRRRPGFRPALAMRIAALTSEFDADLLHCHHYSSFVYGRLAASLRPGCRVIFTEHGRLSDAPPSSKRRLANRLLMAGVEELIAVSADLRAHLLQEGVPPRMQVVWNGIDPGDPPSPAARAQQRSRLGAGPDDVVALCVARLDPVKDLATAMRAVASARRRLGRLRLFVIGDGPLRHELDRLASEEDAAVELLGHRDDARACLAAADVFVNSSISEGISLTILEAMAAAVPVVATAVGGTPEVVIDGETGRLVPARDVEALAAAILELASDRTKASRLGLAGRRRVVQEFTIDRMVQAYARLYGVRPHSETA